MRLGSLRLFILTQVVVCFDSSGFDSGGCITNTIVGDHITVEAIMLSRTSLDRESTNAVMEEAISAEYSSARPSMFRSAMITDTAVLYAIGSSCLRCTPSSPCGLPFVIPIHSLLVPTCEER